MATTGTVWAGLLGLQTSRFDLLEVWDPVLELYVNIIDALEAMQTQLDSIQLEDTSRLDAIEAKLASLDQQKASKFEAISPLTLDEGVFPNQLSQSEGPAPQSASAINFNGEDAYIQFDGRTHVLDYTKDWSVGCSIQTQNLGVEGSNMTAFSSGGCSLNIKIQGAPSISSN